MKRAVAAALAALAFAPAAAAAAPRVSVEPQAIRFGDNVVATAAAPLAVLPPWRALAPAERAGRTWRLRIACLDAGCPAGPAPVFRVGGTTVRAAVRVSPRAGAAAAAAARPPFREQVAVPPQRYRVDPTATAAALWALAAVLVTAAAFALRPRRVDRRSPLERALAAVRDARSRPPADRRKAVAALTRELRSSGLDDLGGDRLAWSAPAPAAEALDELASTVERQVGGGT